MSRGDLERLSKDELIELVLKLIKRQSYGRAGLDLLQRRLILAA